MPRIFRSPKQRYTCLITMNGRVHGKSIEARKLRKADGTIPEVSAGFLDKCDTAIEVISNRTFVYWYFTRAAGKTFDYKSPDTLCKAMGVTAGDMQLEHLPKTDRNPDRFFRAHIDLSKDIRGQLGILKGVYEDVGCIRGVIEADEKKKRTLLIAAAVKKKGTMGALTDGTITHTEFKSVQHVEEMTAQKSEADARRSRDMPEDAPWGFTNIKTGVDHIIHAFPASEEADAKDFEDVYERRYDAESKKMVTHLVKGGSRHCTVKKKHYYFYSPAGYGKTYFMDCFLTKNNADVVGDPRNLCKVSTDAQFLFVDEYGTTKRFNMTDLNALTSGDARSYAGNRKSHGASFMPRRDVQLIILSNHHLFGCMGTYNQSSKDYKISEVDAKALRDRFNIIKMDEGFEGAGTELEDAEKFIARTTLKRSGCDDDSPSPKYPREAVEEEGFDFTTLMKGL